MKKAFTLIELVVSIALLSIVFVFAGVIFKVSINAYRIAAANAEIMQKLRAITDQLNADFKGLRKDGEIFVIWEARKLDTAAAEYDGYRDCDNDEHERFDRIMFFADGDFQSYSSVPKVIRGNTARICYMLAKTKDESGTWKRPEQYRDPVSVTEQGRKFREEDRRGRILSRTQHILTADPDPALNNFPTNFSSFTDDDWYEWNNIDEYDKITLDGWKNIYDVNDMLSVIIDVNFTNTVFVSQDARGTKIDPAGDANTIRNLLCEGVGEFKIQGWFDDERRWFPEVDPDADGSFCDSDLIIDAGCNIDKRWVPGVWYPFGLSINSRVPPIKVPPTIDEAHFNEIPGLGRALKFTFTLYDSKGVIKEGRTFTHIVYLEN